MDLDKASLRANVLERKKLEQLVSIYESSKRNLISDMRKTQAMFRKRLKAYRERKREILILKSKNSDSSMEELLIEQLRYKSKHWNNNTGRQISSKGEETLEALTRNQTTISNFSDEDLDSAKVFKTRLSAYAEEPNMLISKQQTTLSHSLGKDQSPGTDIIVTVENAVKTLSAVEPRASQRHLLTAKTVPIRNVRHASASPSVPAQKVSQPSSADVKRTTPCLNKAMIKVDRRLTDIHPLPAISGTSEGRDRGITTSNFEMPRTSSRQRSRLDLRPRTAWELLNSNTSFSNRRQDILQHAAAVSSRQIVYLDKDELDERGTFYNYLLKGRLEREHTRFQEICHKVQDFCRSPSSKDTGSRIQNRRETVTLNDRHGSDVSENFHPCQSEN